MIVNYYTTFCNGISFVVLLCVILLPIYCYSFIEKLMYIFVLFVISLCFAFDSQLYANTLVMCLPRQNFILAIHQEI